jgi:hypothetical protein
VVDPSTDHKESDLPMKLRTVHLWLAVVVWLYAVNFGAGLLAYSRGSRPRDQLVLQPQEEPQGRPQEPQEPHEEPQGPHEDLPVRPQEPQEEPQGPKWPPRAAPKLKGQVIVLVLLGEGIEGGRGYYDGEFDAIARGKANELLGGAVWVLGPGAEPQPWPGPARPKSFACDQAIEAFASVKEALAWFDSHAEAPGLPAVLIWPCDQNPDLAAAPPPARAEGRVEHVVWVGGTGDSDSQWLVNGFGASNVTRIVGRPGGQLARSVRFIVDGSASPPPHP